MEPDQTDSPDAEKKGELDLSSLLNVDFVSRNWEEDRNRNTFQERGPREDRFRDRRRGGDQDRRDRRSAPPRSGGRGDESGGERRPPRGEGDERRRGGRRYEREQVPVAPKLVHVQFFPEEHAFNALIKALRQSGQTHELFTLARLFLEKPERLMIAISPLDEAGPEAKLFICKIDGTPFLSETEVYQHVFQNHLHQFVDEEQIEVEAPKGSFQSIARCPRTKVLLCPPNYHLYPQTVLEHKERYFPGESLEAVRNRLELVRDEEVIQEWLNSMTQKTRYRLISQKKAAKPASPETPAEPVEATNSVDSVENTEAANPVEAVEPDLSTEASQPEPVATEEADLSAEAAPTEQAEAGTAESADSEATMEVTSPVEPEGAVFESLEELKTWLQEHLRHRIVKTIRQYRIGGKVLADLAETPIKHSIQQSLEEQRRFPLDTANLLRGRFRRLKFDLFKHGVRGINYVCPVKRKIKDSRVPWSDSVEQLYTQIGHLPTATIQTLADAVLGHPLEYYQGEAAASLSDAEKKAYSSLVADLHWLVMEGYVSRFEDGHLEIPKGHVSEEHDAERH